MTKEHIKLKRRYIYLFIVTVLLGACLYFMHGVGRADTNPTFTISSDGAVATKQAVRLERFQETPLVPAPEIEAAVEYKMFECGWINRGLRARGVAEAWVDFAVAVAKRESACCPNLKGGDVTRDDCSIWYVIRWDHRSDTGAFQFNGVHWKTERGIFCPEYSCNQNDILDNPKMQLDMMVTMMSKCGKKPWQKGWGCSPANIFD